MYIILFSEKHRRKKEQFWWLLKELRNCNSCIIRTWPLFCSFWIYINLPFCTYSFKKIVSFLPFLPSGLFWFWLWRSPYTLYIIVYIDPSALWFCLEAVARRCSIKKVFLKKLQNSQENISARVAYLIKEPLLFVFILCKLFVKT